MAIEIERKFLVQGQGWRINKLDDVTFYAGTHTPLEALVARDGRLLRLPLEMPPIQPTGAPAKGRRSTAAPSTALRAAATDSAVCSGIRFTPPR